MSESSSKFTHEDYTVGWICALPRTELVAAEAMLDEEHPILPAVHPQDPNVYTLGRIGDHNVVIACLPAETTGKVSAASVARDMVRSFPAVRFGLMVGIGGGVPYYGSRLDDGDTYSSDSEEEPNSDVRDIRLGDVVISLHSKDTEAVVQYDFGKSLKGKGFVRIGGKLNKPPPAVLNAVSRLQGQHVRKGTRIPQLLDMALEKYPRIAESFRYPRAAKDRLFKPRAVHNEGKRSCKHCCGPDNINLVRRPERATSAPRIHYGTIGSADQVIRDATIRDNWAEKENIICFEMEAAGLMDLFPCLVIRGICDYADSHKNKAWQPYAAATAASYAKELLLLMPGQDVAGLNPIKQMSVQLGRIEERTVEVKDAVLLTQEEIQRNKILSLLSTLDYNPRQIDIFSQHTEGSGTWLLNTISFTTWRDTLGQTLYCPGIPGAGKTVLASVIIDHLRQKLQENNAALAFVYCAYNDNKTAEDLIRCLLKQIVSQIPTIPDEIISLHDLYHSTNKPTPRIDDVIRTLQSILSKFSRIYIVIDAIDEFNDLERSDLLDALDKIRVSVNILVTSRPVASIKKLLHPDIEQPIEAADEDIIAYIRGQISRKRLNLSEELLKKPELHAQIVSQLVESAKGMFLHAKFHVGYLSRKHTIRDLREALLNLPKTSEGIYESAMERVQCQDKETAFLANRTLQCVLGAVRFLRIRELQDALAVREGDHDIDEEALTPPTYLLSICAGLLTFDQEDGVVRLVHYTAHEYLKENEQKYFSNAQGELASICLNYLSLGVFDFVYRDTLRKNYMQCYQRHALLKYATQNMGKHASGGFNSATLQHAVKLFLNKSKVSVAIEATFHAHYRPHNIFSDLTPTHYASYLGLADVVGQLIERSHEKMDLKDRYGRTPLSWAARSGHNTVVKLLANTGKVDVDSKDQYGWTPLSWAAENSHNTVVKLLVNTGKVDVDSKDQYGRTPLSRAADSGYDTVVKLLANTGKVDMDSKDQYSRTPLSFAAARGHNTVVKLLVNTRKVDVDSKDEDGRTPLSWAAWAGHVAVVKLLVDTGKVDIDLKDQYGRTPLSRAARSGYNEVVKLLVNTGKVDIDSKDQDSLTPLSRAADSGYDKVVKLLVDTGKVDINSKDEDGQTPLSRAARSGHDEVVKLLINTGKVDAVQ